jgi:phosphonate transport system substrate-binding protein
VIKKILFVGVAMGLLTFQGCTKEDAKEVRLDERKSIENIVVPHEEGSLRIAVGAMITPKEGFAYYRHLLDYIGKKLGKPIEFVDKESYAEINELLKTGQLDAAFVCSGPYVDGHDDFELELLVAPQAYGESVYYSYIIVNTDSQVKSFEELQGKTFAFTDPKSNTGKLVPTYLLSKIGQTPDSFFKEYRFTYAHDKSIKVVAHGLVDGAAVDSLIWEYTNKIAPELTSRTRVILKSQPYGIPPFVVSSGFDPETKEKMKEILLDVHNDEEGREILKGMMIDKFVPVDDSAYDSIREMKSWISKQKQ